MQMHIKRIRKKTVLLIALAVWAPFYLHQCMVVHPGFFSSANNGDLSNFQIPTIPGKFKPWRSSYGGLFAKRFFMVTDLSPEVYAGYLAKVAADADEKLTIGKDVRIITIENFDRENREQDDNTNNPFADFSKNDIVDLNEEWWDVDRIPSGTLFRKKLPDACDYKIIFDDRRHRVFVHWHYS